MPIVYHIEYHIKADNDNEAINNVMNAIGWSPTGVLFKNKFDALREASQYELNYDLPPFKKLCRVVTRHVTMDDAINHGLARKDQALWWPQESQHNLVMSEST